LSGAFGWLFLRVAVPMYKTVASVAERLGRGEGDIVVDKGVWRKGQVVLFDYGV